MESNMIDITLTPEASAKFKKLLAEENSSDTVFRIREAKVGCACKSHMELRMGMDERGDAEDEQEVLCEGMPFVIGNDVIDIYGTRYSISLDENELPRILSSDK